ncbi:zinc-binding dehydrogenase [Streptomyces sp. NPDC005423]|uniref:zinc-binding dehydrogenase n=1 Tax=Streptomyces sp. NPDC005423 TaxID=3155343 RepID=UPI0033A1F44D
MAEAVGKVRPGGVDAVLATARLGQALIGTVADGGRFVTTPLDALPQTERGIRILLTQVGPDGAMLTTLSDLATAGDLALRVAETYPLQDASKASGWMPHRRAQRLFHPGIISSWDGSARPGVYRPPQAPQTAARTRRR